MLVMDEKKSNLEDTYHKASTVNEVFMEVCRLELERNELSCTGMYRFNRNIFNVLAFLPSPQPPGVKPIANVVTDMPPASTSGNRQM
jgi:hypothetical protein